MHEIPEAGVPAPASFAHWLRPKRRAYQWLVLACALVALAIPLLMHWVDFQLRASGGWEAANEFVQLRARLGIPWWLLAWLFPFAYAAMVAALLLAFEAIWYFPRLDRGDHAWSSMLWTLRGWKAALPWLFAASLVVLLIFALADSLVPQGLDWLGMPSAMLEFVLPFFVWNAAYLAASRPMLRVRPRWPGWMPMIVVLVYCLFAFAAAKWLFGDLSSTPQVVASVGVIVLLYWFACVAVPILWLNGRRPGATAALRHGLRDAIRPRVFLPMLVLLVRWLAWIPLLLLPLLPLFFFLSDVLPMLEHLLASCCAASGRLSTLVAASRFVVAWWWLGAMGLMAVVAIFPPAWFNTVSSGRLLLELGVVRSEPPREQD